MKIALLGPEGYVGSSIYEKIKNHKVTPITRNTVMSGIDKNLDLVIHSANPAKRYLANKDPMKDFKETIEKTKTIINDFKGVPIILISSISCRTQKDTPYGLHRLACEDLILKSGGTVFRLGPLFGGNREKDIIHDIANNKPVYHSKKTKYAYCNVNWAAQYISENLSIGSGTYEIGARNVVTLEELAEAVGSSSTFENKADDQYPLGFSDGPDAYEAVEYITSLKNR
jgi:nucleoside-diphosphate-sugar epimerase